MESQTPYDLLRNIAESLREYHSETADMDYQEAWRGIHFQVGELCILTSILQIKEVIPPTNLLTLPRIKPWLKGVIQHRGELVLINDLGHYLFNRPTEFDLQARVLVVEYQHEKVGFLVPKIFGIVALPKPLKKPYMDELLSSHQAYLKESLDVQDSVCPILDFHQLLEHPNFLQANVT